MMKGGIRGEVKRREDTQGRRGGGFLPRILAHLLDGGPGAHVPIVASEEPRRVEHLLRPRHVPRASANVPHGDPGGGSGGARPELERCEPDHERGDELVVIQLGVGTL